MFEYDTIANTNPTAPAYEGDPDPVGKGRFMEFQDGRFGPRFILFRDRLNNNTHWTSLGLKGDTAYLL